jgi:hypothetical protein
MKVTFSGGACDKCGSPNRTVEREITMEQQGDSGYCLKSRRMASS